LLALDGCRLVGGPGGLAPVGVQADAHVCIIMLDDLNYLVHGNGQGKLLGHLAVQALFDCLARLALAAGEFPEMRERGIG
jgi:hypothetical protein